MRVEGEHVIDRCATGATIDLLVHMFFECSQLEHECATTSVVWTSELNEV